MFYHDDGVAVVEEFFQDEEESFDVFGVESDGWLVEEVEGVAFVGFQEVGDEFESLGFTT